MKEIAYLSHPNTNKNIQAKQVVENKSKQLKLKLHKCKGTHSGLKITHQINTSRIFEGNADKNGRE